jgi:hypothetical protein
MTAFRLELRRNRSLTLWLGVAIGGYAVVMGLMYPILKANDDLMQQYMETFPKEFLAAFGMTGLLSDPGVFFTTYISSWLWPIIAAASGLLIGTRAVAADLDRGFLDLPLSTRVSRLRYLAASIWGQVVVMAILATVTVLGLWAAGRLVGAEFDLGRFALGGLLAFAFGCAIAGATTLCSVVTLSRGLSAGIVGGALIVMYAIYVVAQVASAWAWLGPLSAWDHFPTTRVIDEGEVPLGDLALFAAIAIGGWLAALWGFRRRDLAA